MTPMAKETDSSGKFQELKTKLKATWMTGDYDTFSRPMERGAHEFYWSLGVTTGGKVTAGAASPSSPLAVTAKVQLYFGNPSIKEAEVRFRAAHPEATAETLEPLYYRDALRQLLPRSGRRLLGRVEGRS